MGFLAWLFTSLGLGSSPEALVHRAAALGAKGNLSASVELYKKVIESNPYYSAAYDGLGRVYHKMDFRDEAERVFAIADGLEAWKKNPHDSKTALKLAKAMMNRGLFAQARSCLLPVLSDNSRDPDMLKTMGLCCRALNDDRRAREFLLQALDGNSNDPDLYLKLGEIELKNGQKKQGGWLMEMSRYLSRAEAEPNDPAVQLQVGLQFCGNERYSAAIPFFIRCIELDPALTRAYTGLAAAYQGVNQPQSAIEILQKAIARESEDPAIFDLLSKAYSQAGNFKMARSARETAATLQAGKEGASDPGQAARYIRHLMNQKKTDSAQAKLDEAINRWPDDFNLRVLRGIMLFQDNQLERTLEVMLEVANLNPQAAEPHLYMAMAYNRLGQNMNALAEGQLSTRLAPDNPESHKILGDIYRDQEKFSLASASYETSERLAGTRKK